MYILWLVVLGITVIVIGTIYKIQTHESIQSIQSNNPWTIWWYVDIDDKKTNERPYLHVCLRRAQKLWGGEFTIIPIVGRDAALNLLAEKNIPVPEGAVRTPPDLWNRWLRATMLAHLGGLWMEGSVLPIATGTALKQKLMNGSNTIVFESAGFSLTSLTSLTSSQTIWTSQRDTLTEIIMKGEPYWSTFETEINTEETVCSYEDLFERTNLETMDWKSMMWVSLPPGGINKLEMASTYLWFVNLSEGEISESDFVWAKLSRT